MKTYFDIQHIRQYYYLGKPYEYLLVVSPGNSVNRTVTEIKDYFAERYGALNSKGLKPHITILNFIQHSVAEHRIITLFESYSKSVSEYNIRLKGFGKFGLHTIYVNVDTKKATERIARELRKFKRSLRFCDEIKPKFVDTPHLTIARGMTEQQCNDAWADWQDKVYEDSFSVNGMLLLRRELNEFSLKPQSTFDPVKFFHFTGGGNNGRQLALIN